MLSRLSFSSHKFTECSNHIYLTQWNRGKYQKGTHGLISASTSFQIDSLFPLPTEDVKNSRLWTEYFFPEFWLNRLGWGLGLCMFPVLFGKF